MITFISLDKENRTVSFDVNGNEVTRNIPAVFDGTIDDYISALASGLAIEFSDVQEKSIDDTSFTSGEELI